MKTTTSTKDKLKTFFTQTDICLDLKLDDLTAEEFLKIRKPLRSKVDSISIKYSIGNHNYQFNFEKKGVHINKINDSTQTRQPTEVSNRLYDIRQYLLNSGSSIDSAKRFVKEFPSKDNEAINSIDLHFAAIRHKATKKFSKIKDKMSYRTITPFKNMDYVGLINR